MFCRFCGKQVLDEAYMCPSCGGMLKPLPKTANEPAAEPVSNEPSKAQKTFQKLSRIFTKIGIILNAVAFGAGIFAVIFMIVGLVGAENYEYYSQISSSTMEQIENAEAMMGLGVMNWFVWGILALVAIAASEELSTAGFVFSLIQRIDPSMKKKSIPVFVVSVVLTYLILYLFIGGAYIFALSAAL